MAGEGGVEADKLQVLNRELQLGGSGEEQGRRHAQCPPLHLVSSLTQHELSPTKLLRGKSTPSPPCRCLGRNTLSISLTLGPGTAWNGSWRTIWKLQHSGGKESCAAVSALWVETCLSTVYSRGRS